MLQEQSRTTVRRARAGVCAATIAALLLVTSAAWAQRVQFPSMVADPNTTYGQAPQAYGSPSTVYRQPGSPYSPPPGPAYTPQPPAYSQPAYPPPGSFYQPAPSATLDGTIQPLAPGWDPYAGPGTQPPALLPQGGYIQPDGMMAQPQRLLDEIRFDYTFLNGNSAQELGVDSLELSATFAFPFLYNAAPLLITPGFAVHYFEGPVTEALPGGPDLPPRVYDAFLEAGWQPTITNWLSADLAASVGVYSDFQRWGSDAIRVRGHGLGIFKLTPQFSVAAGVAYINRNRVKLLPAGGVIWTPTPDARWEILFPRPRIAQRFTTVGNTDWWWYVAGEYGGGAWAIERAMGFDDNFDYNDLRLILGLEWMTFGGWTGHFEVGYVFNRELIYVTQTPTFKPNDTIMLRAGVAF